MDRNSKEIEAELNQTKNYHREKIKKREELKKKLEEVEAEIAEMFSVRWGSQKTGRIPVLEQEFHTAKEREYRDTLPAPILKLHPKWETVNYKIEKVTAKRIYLSPSSGSSFYVSRDGSDNWSQRWGLDIPATIAVWEQHQINNSPTRKP